MTIFPTKPRTPPRQLLVGIGLVAVFWSTAWMRTGFVSQHSFFPLWLGYILVVDGLVLLRTGTSLLTRGRLPFALLFVASIPMWWIFEAFNARLGSWSYVLPHRNSWLRYHLEASVAFSTVVPAIFGTAELLRSFGWIRRIGRWRRLNPSPVQIKLIAVAGLCMLAASLIWPRQAFGLVWLGLFFILDPIATARGAPSFSRQARTGWWGDVVAFCLAGITCGIFWEMWNYWSLPKWRYNVPYVGFLRVFEMPVLGFTGYLPFALETFAFVQLVSSLTRWWPDGYFRLGERSPAD